MAFNGTKFAKLSPGANSNIPQIFGYHAGADAIGASAGNVGEAGYFNAKRDELNVGDTIHVVSTDSTLTWMDYVVTAAADSPSVADVTVSAKWDLVD